MSFAANPQQQAAFVAHLQQQQAAAGRPPLTQQQLQQMVAALQLRQQQQQQQQAQQAQQAQQQQANPTGIQTKERPLGDGDSDHANAVAKPQSRRKPTDRSLPRSFLPAAHAHPTSAGDESASPTDRKLAGSLEALETLSGHYHTLQRIERSVDWTLARKAHEVNEQAVGSLAGRGQPFKRTLRVHVVATVEDQPWQLSAEQLAAESAEPSSSTKIPRVQVRVSGEVLEIEFLSDAPPPQDERYPSDSTPFTQFLDRLVIETPNRDTATYPTSSQPLTWTRPAKTTTTTTPAPPNEPPALPAAISASFPTSSPLALRLALYLHHPAGDRFALHPELAAVLDCAESDRVGVLEALWAYSKNRGLVVEQGSDGGPGAPPGTGAGQVPPAAAAGGGALKTGIKTDEKTTKFFGNVGMVAFHHVPEYLNRWLMPPAPRLVNLTIPVDPSASASYHTAYDLDLFVPDPSRPALEACARALADLGAVAPSPSGTPSGSSSGQVPTRSSLAATAAAAAELSALDDKIAVNALATSQHLRQLQALMSFSRDPVSFLERFVESQAGSLEQILSSNAAGTSGDRGAHSAANGMDLVLGPRWRDEVRKSENWESGEWVDDAIAVWGMREKEGEAQRLRAMQQQRQQPLAGGGRR